MDKFPEAFRRFENDVDVGRLESYHQLTLSFRWWAGQRWKGSYRQWNALNAEAENLGFHVPDVYREAIREKRYTDFYGRRNSTWKRETVSIRGVTQARYRDVRTGRFIKKP
jgi:predicted glycosyltransferase involved in capsule biosynthesis